MKPRSGAIEALSGILLIVLGLGLLAEVAWHWHRNTPRQEPVDVGTIPSSSGSHWRFDEAELQEAFEQGRRDRRWMQIHRYAIAPSGVLLLLAGTWLVTSDYRRRSSRDA
jgi:hypothetical protein